MVRYVIICIFGVIIFTPVIAQLKTFGAGSEHSATVRTSSSFTRDYSKEISSGAKTLDGSGLNFHQYNASRFLTQATLGPSFHDILSLKESDFESWIDNQISLPVSDIHSEFWNVNEEVIDLFLMNGGDSSEINLRPGWPVFNYAWWNLNTTNQDKLRHRIALALSEIFVVSINSELEGYGEGLASYYDIFVNNAFGNYRDILQKVTLHPAMGYYLSHLNNPKTIPSENIHPDENYAREIMQLFSIGLYELNPDGSRKLDNTGNFIPTYDQQDIKEFAKIFTGLGLGAIMENEYFEDPVFFLDIYFANMVVPMQMFDEWHEPGEKFLLQDKIVPSGQSGMKDISDAIENLFNHPNVAPFIGKQLIQRLVKSNPSDGYISRVTAAFNNNGSGVRGDMIAVIKAILLDQEARDCEWLTQPHSGMLREPIVRYTNFTNALDIEQFYGRYWNIGYSFKQSTGQSPLWSPSVFNFFLPDYQPSGEIEEKGLVAPEFQIHNTKTSIGFINEVNTWAVWNVVMSSWQEYEPAAFININELKDKARDSEVLINRLDLLFTNGNMTSRTRRIIKNAIEPLRGGDYRESRVRLALYLVMISPDYSIFK